MQGLAAYALKASNVRPGDVLIVSSVSGRTLSVVDLAFEAKKIGKTPGILRSANFPGSPEYNKSIVEPQYMERGW